MRMIVTLVVWALVIRYLGPERYGVFSYALSFVFLFNILSLLGLDMFVIREIIKNRAEQNKILGTTFFLKLIGSLFAILLMVAVMYIFSFSHELKIVISTISLGLIFQSFDNIDYYFQSKVLSKFTVYAQIVSLLMTTVLSLLFVHFKMPLIYFVYVVVIETAVVCGGLIIFYTHQGENILTWRFDLPTAKKLLKDSWPAMLSGLAVAVYMRFDQVIVKELMGMTAVGYYSAAVRISEVFYFVPILLTNSFFPAIVNSKLKDQHLYHNRLKALFTILFWFAVGFSSVITIFAAPLVNFLYGPAYAPAIGVLSLHIWASIFVFLGVVRGRWLIVENLQFYMMVYTIVGAITNMVLNFILIPQFGIMGAAIATVFSQFIAAVLSSLFNKKTKEIFFLLLDSINLPKALKNVYHSA